MRTFNDEQVFGLYSRAIPHDKVNADLEGVVEGDMFENEEKDRLIYFNHGFVIFTDNPRNFLLQEDLTKLFKNYDRQYRTD